MANNTINKKELSIVPILLDHLDRYPLLTIQDIYKLIYQAAMGPEHLITDNNRAYTRLVEELTNINESISFSIYEDIDPIGHLVRLNLNPFKQSQGDPKKLFEAFYGTLLIFCADVEDIKIYLKQTINSAENNLISFEPDELRSFFSLKESQNFPAVPHSDIYRKSYHPAYRLIGKTLLHLLD